MKQSIASGAAAQAGASACRASTAILALFLYAHAPLAAQTTTGTVNPVPFVGCKSDGQSGPVDPPRGNDQAIRIAPGDAERLAYFKASEDGFGVLAPRGWHCFNTYGSNGATLYVSPDPIDADELFSSNWKGFSGPAIEVSMMNGDTSGRFDVARVIARVFPAHIDFVETVIAEGIEPASDFPRGPFPADKLVYRSKEVVEFVTPPNTEGLGTQSRLLKNGDPITGAAILVGEGPDLVQLSIRLPAELRSLAPAIVTQAEQEVMKAAGSK